MPGGSAWHASYDLMGGKSLKEYVLTVAFPNIGTISIKMGF
jgi:hypothetical protein